MGAGPRLRCRPFRLQHLTLASHDPAARQRDAAAEADRDVVTGASGAVVVVGGPHPAGWRLVKQQCKRRRIDGAFDDRRIATGMPLGGRGRIGEIDVPKLPRLEKVLLMSWIWRLVATTASVKSLNLLNLFADG